MSWSHHLFKSQTRIIVIMFPLVASSHTEDLRRTEFGGIIMMNQCPPLWYFLWYVQSGRPFCPVKWVTIRQQKRHSFLLFGSTYSQSQDNTALSSLNILRGEPCAKLFPVTSRRMQMYQRQPSTVTHLLQHLHYESDSCFSEVLYSSKGEKVPEIYSKV